MRRPSRLTRMVTIVIVGLTVVGALGVRPASAQTNPVSSITVSGVGTASARPDIATVELGYEILNTSLDAAYSKANDTTNGITQAVLKLNVAPADIQATKMSITPTDRVDERGAPTGEFLYRVHSTLRVTIRNVAQVKPIIDAALAAGANAIDNLSYGIDDMAPLEREARTQAINDAKGRAQQLADALGVVVGDPLTITETTINNAGQVGGGSRGASIKAQGTADNAGQLVVTVQIQMTFTLKKR